MYKIEYDISLNENERPFIFLPEDYEQRPEDRFFAIEITRYILGDLLARRTTDLDSNTIQYMNDAEKLLGQLGDEMSVILSDSMEAAGELKMMIDVNYHIKLNSIEERNDLLDTKIIYDGIIYNRVEGLKVGIQCYDNDFLPYIDIYELVDGITNEHWVKL